MSGRSARDTATVGTCRKLADGPAALRLASNERKPG
jgi:hypothetical protein